MDELIAGADAHDALVNAWPAEEQKGDRAFIEHAISKYNRGLAWSLRDRKAEGYAELRAAVDDLVAAEKRAPGNPTMLYWIGWAGADGYMPRLYRWTKRLRVKTCWSPLGGLWGGWSRSRIAMSQPAC